MGEFPLLAQLQQQYGSQGFAIVGISVDTECGKARDIVRSKGVSWPVICDGKSVGGSIPRLYNAAGTPVYYVLDRQGRIAAKKIPGGKIRETVEKTLAPARAAQEKGSGSRGQR